MIENGATAAELTYALGHLNQATAAKYYAEVRKRRQAELNTEFYREAFDVRLSSEQLAVFSEEERRMLYVDFCLGNRRVASALESCVRVPVKAAADSSLCQLSAALHRHKISALLEQAAGIAEGTCSYFRSWVQRCRN